MSTLLLFFRSERRATNMNPFTISTKHLNDVEKYSRYLCDTHVSYWVSIESVTSHNKYYVFHLYCTEKAFNQVLADLRIKMKGVK